MYKFLITTLLLLLNISYSADLQGKITYTVQSARIEAFKDLARKIPKEMFQNYKKDKYQKENLQSIKNNIYIIDKEPKRNVNPFYALSKMVLYSVEYEDDINKKYYYNLLGNLVKYEINDFSGVYPYRAIAYNKNGNVINITFIVSETESFIFDKNEKLIGHWYENNFYNEKGSKSYQRILK